MLTVLKLVGLFFLSEAIQTVDVSDPELWNYGCKRLEQMLQPLPVVGKGWYYLQAARMLLTSVCVYVRQKILSVS